MSRRRKNNGISEMEAGQDCFLDIVSNIVGILIILVMVAGVRAKHLPIRMSIAENAVENTTENAVESIAVSPDPEKSGALLKELENFAEKSTAFRTAQAKTQEIAEEVEHIRGLISARAHDRAELLAMISIIKTEYDFATENLSKAERESLELNQKIRELDNQLTEMERTKTWIEQQRPSAKMIENMPTPLTKTVERDEAHFRLKGGRIVHIPYDLLMLKMKSEAMIRKEEAFQKKEINGVVGPIDNFTMPYRVIVRTNVPMQTARGVTQGARMEFDMSEFVPQHDIMGETLQEALAANSEFRRRLRAYRQDRHTITVWVYADSFNDYREIKKFLFEHGFKTAARMLTLDSPIGASSSGTKTSAQ